MVLAASGWCPACCISHLTTPPATPPRPSPPAPSCRRAGRPAHALPRGRAARGDQQRRHDGGLVPLPARLPALHIHQDLQHGWVGGQLAGQGLHCLDPGFCPKRQTLLRLLPLPAAHAAPPARPPPPPPSAPLPACSAQRQPRGLRHHLQAAQHYRVGVSRAWPGGAGGWRHSGFGARCPRAPAPRVHTTNALHCFLRILQFHFAAISCIQLRYTRSMSSGKGRTLARLALRWRAVAAGQGSRGVGGAWH